MTEAELKEVIRGAMYRLCLSNARWFAARKENYQVTIRSKTYVYEKGESEKWARYWLGQSELYATPAAIVPGAGAQCTGACVGSVTSASGAVSPLVTEKAAQ